MFCRLYFVIFIIFTLLFLKFYLSLLLLGNLIHGLKTNTQLFYIIFFLSNKFADFFIIL